MKKNKKILTLLLLVIFVLSLAPVSAASEVSEDSAEYDFSKIANSWKSLSDGELNNFIGYNNDTEIYEFINGLSEGDRELLLSKDTMLNNTISIDNEDGTFDKMPYYDWIMKNGRQAAPMRMQSRAGINSTFTAKSGHCFYRFVDNNSGYIVRYKVTFTLDSINNAESESNDYTVGSVIFATGGENTNNTVINQVTFEKQKKYMKKAATVHKELSDGSAGEMRDGQKIYPTAITPIFVLTVKVPKPINTYGEWDTGGFSMNGVEQSLAKGSRFNFREYNWQCTGESTFDSKVYHERKVNELTSCVNILSCGFTVENEGSLGLAEGVPEVDTINVVYKHPTLNIAFYPNGGEVTKTSYNPNAESPMYRSVLYNKVYHTENGLPMVSTFGYKKEGYSPVEGKEWKNSDGSKTWDESNLKYRAVDLLDYEDGTFFKSKERSMYVNWQANVYKVTLDNQGAEVSGTENTWYRYNTYGTQTLSDGTVQKNYFYTTSALATPLRDGYKIDKPEKAGYDFQGYFTEKNGQGTKYVNASGSFINQLWKIIGPHTLYASWVKKEPETGKLIIRRNLPKGDYYSSHGDATFIFKVTAENGQSYYRDITFKETDLPSAKNGIVTLEAECSLPYGKYTVESLKVFRFKSKLSSLSSGSITSEIKGEFQINESNKEVVAVYDGGKSDWQRFSHNNIVINRLKE